MAVHLTTTLKQLDLEDIRELAHIQGLCVTIHIPDSHPGAAEDHRQAQLRQLTHKAVELLGHMHATPGAAELAEALPKFVGSIDSAGGPGYTLFMAPGRHEAFRTPGVEAGAFAGGQFHILPLIAIAAAPKDFYALGLSRKSVRLWHVTPADCQEVDLPHTVPPNLDTVRGEVTGRNLQNRSTVGTNTGKMNSMRFGTASEYDSDPEYLAHFFGMVAKGLHDVVRDAPVFLIGTRPDTLVYRKAAHGANLFEAESHANPALSTSAQVEAEARTAAAEELHRKAELAITLLPHVREKIVNDPAAALKAASEGRVRDLFIAESARTANNGPGAEDAANAAAVETFRTGGVVHMLRGEMLPGGGSIAAALRY